MLVTVLTLLLIGGCNGVVYSINSSEYRRMPPMYQLDDFDGCMLDAGGTYCVIDLDLFTTEPSTLMQLIDEYSADTKKHFNHTLIHRAVCVTQTCAHINSTWGLSTTLEVCLNESIWREYSLQARLNRVHYCKSKDEQLDLDTSDFIMIIVYLILIALNVIGSLYDVLFCQPNCKSGNAYVLAFSLRRNWAKLVASSGAGPEPRMERLKSFHGLRAMTMVCVIFSHAVLVMGNGYIENPLYVEKAFEDPIKQILFNGSLVTHTFFVMSSFLLAYNFETNAEKHKVSWWHFPKGVLLRWIRLTPSYALVLATIATLMRHMGSGPTWDLVVTAESNACRQYWWAHLLYVHNYLYEDKCMMATWYLAADTQLFCFGLLLCLVFRSSRARKRALAATFLLSLAITSATTYFENLDAIVIQSPESARTVYDDNDTFHRMYVLGHTNLSTYTLGLAGGFLVYRWQSQGKDLEEYKKYRWIVWLLFPLGVLLILSGAIFYIEDWSVPRAIEIIYATFYKPLFQLFIVAFILSCIFKLESVYRPIVEWRGFTWSGRLTYGAYLLHVMFLRGFAGSQRQSTYISDYNVLVLLAATVMMSFLTAAPLWLFVEAPVAGITKAALTRAPERFNGQ
ncbi:unnamed protein product, partial [Iphiclides podalirius]